MPLYGFHVLCMLNKNAGTFKVCIRMNFPNPYRFITPAACQKVTIVTERDALAFALVSLQCAKAFPIWASSTHWWSNIIRNVFPKSHRAIKGASGQNIASWRPWNASYCSFVSRRNDFFESEHCFWPARNTRRQLFVRVQAHILISWARSQQWLFRVPS